MYLVEGLGSQGIECDMAEGAHCSGHPAKGPVLPVHRTKRAVVSTSYTRPDICCMLADDCSCCGKSPVLR